MLKLFLDKLRYRRAGGVISSLTIEGDVRIKWTAASLYKNIMANTPDSFLELNKDVLTREEFNTFVEDLKKKYTTKEAAIPILKTYMNTMRGRRARYAKKELE
jgi:hypothetical protein